MVCHYTVGISESKIKFHVSNHQTQISEKKIVAFTSFWPNINILPQLGERWCRNLTPRSLFRTKILKKPRGEPVSIHAAEHPDPSLRWPECFVQRYVPKAPFWKLLVNDCLFVGCVISRYRWSSAVKWHADRWAPASRFLQNSGTKYWSRALIFDRRFLRAEARY